MRLAATVVAMAMVAGPSAKAKPNEMRKVVVYFTDSASVPFSVKRPAQNQAADMFAQIGIHLHWRAGTPPQSEASPLVLEFGARTPANLLPNALAYALPYEGVHIRIFWDRISASPNPRGLLAHVIVHEITHILQGVARHSETGIMKARFTNEDRSMMKTRPFGFTPEDVALVYKGVDHRDDSRSIAGTK